MARTDVIVLGAGIVGASAALHLAKRGKSVALVERGAPGEGTSYGNAGLLEGDTFFSYPFPFQFQRILRVALKQAAEANYHLAALPVVASWLVAYARESTPEKMLAFAHKMRPLFARSTAEHEKLIEESGAQRYLSRKGWLKIYRTAEAYEKSKRDLDVIAAAGIDFQPLDMNGALALEPDLAPVFKNAVFWPHTPGLTNPLAVTRAYVHRFEALGGVLLQGDALSLHRSGSNWRVDTAEGSVDASEVVVALGPWAPDLLKRFDIDLPLGVKRGYHRHYKPRGSKTLGRPTLDAEVGYLVAPMEQGLRLTTGAEFTYRDAPATPVQFDRLLPQARELFPLGEQAEERTWLGARPCFPDSMPVIGRAPKQEGMWLNYGHAHWGLTLAAVSGLLLTEMMTGETPFTDPSPYSADRFR